MRMCIPNRSMLVVVMLAALAPGCTQQPAGEIADTVYTNGRIYTVNEAQPWAEAVAINDGMLAEVSPC
jgi:hypothetical protein